MLYITFQLELQHQEISVIGREKHYLENTLRINIPDELNRRLEQLAKNTGQAVGTLVCEAIEEYLGIEERKKGLQAISDHQAVSDRAPLVTLSGSGDCDK
jgi:predicted DNA-binding protein